jgi:hypothetical protein
MTKYLGISGGSWFLMNLFSRAPSGPRETQTHAKKTKTKKNLKNFFCFCFLFVFVFHNHSGLQGPRGILNPVLSSTLRTSWNTNTCKKTKNFLIFFVFCFFLVVFMFHEPFRTSRTSRGYSPCSLEHPQDLVKHKHMQRHKEIKKFFKIFFVFCFLFVFMFHEPFRTSRTSRDLEPCSLEHSQDLVKHKHMQKDTKK